MLVNIKFATCFVYNFFMKVLSVNKPSFGQGQSKKINYVKYTGYAAAGAGVACAATAKKFKVHKAFAWLAGVFTFLHIVSLESYRFVKK